jgi:hypothetical protein
MHHGRLGCVGCCRSPGWQLRASTSCRLAGQRAPAVVVPTAAEPSAARRRRKELHTRIAATRAGDGTGVRRGHRHLAGKNLAGRARRPDLVAQPGRFAGIRRAGSGPGGAAVSQPARRLALERQTALPGARPELRLRPVPVFRGRVARPPGPRWPDRPRRGGRDCGASADVGHTRPQRLDAAPPGFALGGLSLGHAGAGGGLPAVHGRRRVLRTLLRRRVGPCAATGAADGCLRRAGGHHAVRRAARQAQGVRQQELLQLPL